MSGLKTKISRAISYSAFILFLLGFSNFCSCSSRENLENASLPSNYYLDSEKGNDLNDGRSEASPWQSLSKMNSTKLYPGEIIKVKRGSKFVGTLYISDSGSPGNYITITDYGEKQLPAPSFTNPFFDPEKNNYGNCIRLKGSYLIVENLYCHHTVAQLSSNVSGFLTMWELGAIYVDKSAQYCIVKNNELNDCGVGIKSYGQYTVIDNNYIHDCNRVLKEWSWGPIGIWLGADHQEVRYNRIYNYSVVDARITWGSNSYGGGADGGAIEIDDARNNKLNISIHHNYTRDCQGFLEVTWSDVQQNPIYENFAIHHNVSDDYQQFIALWRGANCRIENNTIIRRKKNANEWGVFNITQNNSKNFIRNNIIAVEKGIVIFNVGKNGTAEPNNIIANNLFFSAVGDLIMGKEGPGNLPAYGDPLFVNYYKSDKSEDFALKFGSPAINKGVDLNYLVDFIGTSIPQGGASDIGAFEYK